MTSLVLNRSYFDGPERPLDQNCFADYLNAWLLIKNGLDFQYSKEVLPDLNSFLRKFIIL